MTKMMDWRVRRECGGKGELRGRGSERAREQGIRKIVSYCFGNNSFPAVTTSAAPSPLPAHISTPCGQTVNMGHLPPPSSPVSPAGTASVQLSLLRGHVEALLLAVVVGGGEEAAAVTTEEWRAMAAEDTQRHGLVLPSQAQGDGRQQQVSVRW